MGRTAKYATENERLAAAKERRISYSQSDSAKVLRRTQNQRAYQRLTEQKTPRIFPTWPTIPPALRRQATFPLPTGSHFFIRESRTHEEVSEEDSLAKWDAYPPYRVPHGTIGSGGLEALIDGVHGRRLREQRHSESQRLQRYDTGTDEQILEEIDCAVKSYLGSWYDLKHILADIPTSHIDHIMGTHLMQWKARRVVDLLQDWKAVKKGRKHDAFTLRFFQRW